MSAPAQAGPSGGIFMSFRTFNISGNVLPHTCGECVIQTGFQ